MTDGKEFASANRNSPGTAPLITKLTAGPHWICYDQTIRNFQVSPSDVTAGRLQSGPWWLQVRMNKGATIPNARTVAALPTVSVPTKQAAAEQSALYAASRVMRSEIDRTAPPSNDL
jgi:hypothetical protein